MKVASIDLGSNSFLCLIAEKNDRGDLVEIYDTIEFVKLGEGVHKNRAFSEAALKRADAALSKFRKEIDKHNVLRVSSVATSAARDVSNKKLFFDICEKHQIPVQVISGENEGEYTFLGVLSGRPQKPNFTVIDIGGGSTEFAYKKEEQYISKSFNIGCVRLTEMFFTSDPESEDQIVKFNNYLTENMINIPFSKGELVAVAGTPTTVASLYLERPFDVQAIDGMELSRETLELIYRKLRPLNIEQRRKLKGIDAPRADVIMAGVLILRFVMDQLSLNKLIVSTRGVRYGLAYKMLNG